VPWLKRFAADGGKVVISGDTKMKSVPHERLALWPAPGSEDTELGVLMELEVGHGETEVYAGVQA
jgi:hypothetical protein